MFSIIFGTLVFFSAANQPADLVHPAPSPSHGGQATPFLYQVLSSKRTERTVEPGVVRQRGVMGITVGRGKHSVRYESEQRFEPGGGVSAIGLTDETNKTKARFTLSEDGATATFKFDGQPEHKVIINPDKTITVDGTKHATRAEAIAAVVGGGCFPHGGMEILAAGIEVARAELDGIDKGSGGGKEVGTRIINFFIAVLKAIKDAFFS